MLSINYAIIGAVIAITTGALGWLLNLTRKMEKCENKIESNAVLFHTELEEKQRTIDYLVTAGADIKKENQQTRVDIEVIKNQNVNIEKQLERILELLKK